ncbi:MAG TPA: hypothetical protein DCQ06_14405 [Myxococcales bacterium]|nr:hypothetical protein [Myxococcales bacterium]
MGPLAKFSGWAAGPVMDYKTGARGWLLWPGVALMVAEALTALGLSWRTFARALTMSAQGEQDAVEELDVDEEIPNSWWIGGLLLGSTITVYIANEMFGIAPWLSLIAIALSAVLAIVAVRSVGETDINPIGGMGKVTQLVYGALAPAQMTTNLMTAGITGAGASQAGDMMEDLKTGHLLGASPRKQFGAQLVGIGFGVVFVVPVYMLFSASYEIGGEKLPAPAAFAWKAMAEVLAKGLEALPPHATEAVAIAAAVGIVLPLLRKAPRVAKFVPSGLAMGIAFIIPAFYSLLMFYGMLGWLIWRRVAPDAVDKYNFALASGLVAGEGLIGIVNAALTILGVEPLVK